MTSPPADWYPDPSTGRVRWWDGAGWTDFFADEHPAAPGARRALAENRPPHKQWFPWVMLGVGLLMLALLFGTVFLGMLGAMSANS